ncbi:MAG: 2-dehydropantoate 2-reductase [Elusimicrobia bacterium]|nr:2-dehydropantoate 2-reductase [Elusimicrobiota bacterium]
MSQKGWVAVVGPGAVGGVLAASLRRAGFAVRLAARRPAEARRLAREGLLLTDPHGRSRRVRGLLPLGAHPGPGGPCLAVFLCVKARDLSSALPAARAAAGPATPVVSLLNGVGHEPRVIREVGRSRAVFASCYFAAMREGRGAVRHAGGRRVWVGEGRGNRAAARAAAAVLRAARWSVQLKGDEARVLWTKLVYNAAVNPVAALTRKANGALAADPALREVTLKTLCEARRAAAAAGHPPYPEMTDRGVLAGCRAVPDQMNSMIQDLCEGRRTEVDAILGPLVRAARRRKVPAPTLEALWGAMRSLEGSLS